MREREGFTLIELLVVISTIALLATMVLASVQTARNKAQYVATYAQLGEIKKAILFLHNDTGKMPGGCPLKFNNFPLALQDIFMFLNSSNAGIIERPTAGQVYKFLGITTISECVWSNEEVARWNGPYISSSLLNDPWKLYYMIFYTRSIGAQLANNTWNCPEQWFFDTSYRNAIITYHAGGIGGKGWTIVSMGDKSYYDNQYCRMLLQSINP